jgi:hypothetical protein
MKTNTTTSNKVTARFLVLVVLMLLSSVGMFGQNTAAVPASVTLENTVNTSDETVAASATAAAETSTLNFVSWFMGTKQTSNANGATEVSSNSKKQLINSGIAPNRLLIKAFLKKASNYATTVA